MLGRFFRLLSGGKTQLEEAMPAEVVHMTDDVFGISRDLPMNYVGREKVDSKFVENLTREKHIVVFGSSKQGKTSLRKHCLNDADYITVHCSNKWDLSDLHSNILKRAGYEITLSTKKTSEGRQKIEAKFSVKPLGVGVDVGGSKDKLDAKEVVTKALEIEAGDVNDIIAALTEIGFNKYIVLEDFHYLPVETQKDFSVSLKAFHEASKFCFIVVGVWLEENRLTVYNGDLSGRVTSIDADEWKPEELGGVVEAGEALLNIRFAGATKKSLIVECEGSVAILQEACHKICKDAGINRTQDELREVGGGVDVGGLVRAVVNNQRGRYNSFLTQFADGDVPPLSVAGPFRVRG